MSFTVHRSGDRFVTERPGSSSRYSLSFGEHYDPANTSFGPILAFNDEVVEVGSGFDDHPHRGIDIVTYVVTGSLAHQDNSFWSGTVLQAGEAGVLHTGEGVVHSEVNAGTERLRFIQTWLQPFALEEPTYSTTTGSAERGGLVAIAGPSVHATLYVAHLGQGDAVLLPSAERHWLFVVAGDAVLDGTVLGRGDVARLVAHEGSLTAASDCELLLWALHT